MLESTSTLSRPTAPLILKHFLAYTLLFLLGFGLQAQDISNVDLVSSDNKMVITYDLYGKKSETYTVALLFKTEAGNEIRPKSISGDVGKKITPGKGKSIVWEVYKDVDKLQGSIEPVLKATPSNPEKAEQEKNDIQKAVDLLPSRKKRNRKVVWGWKVGVGSSNAIVNKNSNTFEKRKAWQLGTYMRWNIRRNFYLQPEVLYAKQGYHQELNNNSDNRNIKNHYGRGQLLVGLNPLGNGGLYVNGGMYYGHLLKGISDETINSTTDNIDVLNVETVNGESAWFLTQDYGWIVGGTLSAASGRFGISVLYHEGIPNINNKAYWEGGDLGQTNIKNKGITVSAQFGF